MTEAPAELLGDLGRPEGPARLPFPRPSSLADVCKSPRPLGARKRLGRQGVIDLAWLSVWLRAVEDLGVVELTAFSSPALGTCSWVCVSVFF